MVESVSLSSQSVSLIILIPFLRTENHGSVRKDRRVPKEHTVRHGLSHELTLRALPCMGIPWILVRSISMNTSSFSVHLTWTLVGLRVVHLGNKCVCCNAALGKQ